MISGGRAASSHPVGPPEPLPGAPAAREGQQCCSLRRPAQGRSLPRSEPSLRWEPVCLAWPGRGTPCSQRGRRSQCLGTIVTGWKCVGLMRRAHTASVSRFVQLLRLAGERLPETEGAESAHRVARAPREVRGEAPQKLHQKSEIQRLYLHPWGEAPKFLKTGCLPEIATSFSFVVCCLFFTFSLVTRVKGNIFFFSTMFKPLLDNSYALLVDIS